MILTVMALSGVVLSATAIAGLLVVYQLRQATDLANSAKAVFAADTGIDWALYKRSLTCPRDVSGVPTTPDCATTVPDLLTNGATLEVKCYDVSGNEILYCNSDDPNNPIANIKSLGSSAKSSRAFQLSL